MRLAKAHEVSDSGDRLKHTEYQLVIPRLDGFVETLTQMTKTQFLATDDDRWVVLPRKEANANR